ncbi:hypothetical protein BH10BAC5_BH10BAC5_08850 [soil metagenome]
MTITRQRTAFALTAGIFIACALITLTSKFRQYPDRFSIAVILDLLVTAPVVYFFLIRKTSVSKFTVLRVFMIGVFIATLLLSDINSPVFSFVKTWIAPAAEASLIGYIIWKFYAANRLWKNNHQSKPDFLIYCREILRTVFGNEKLASALASEVSVFYYIFSRKDKGIDDHTRFSSYKENGIVPILYTILGVLVIETSVMHFLFLMWSKTAAWILTGLSFYTCLQLFAHIRAMSARSHVITTGSIAGISSGKILFRSGLLGGDALISLENISRVQTTNSTQVDDAVKLTLLKFEKPNAAIYLKEPVEVVKAFGIKKVTRVLLVRVDNVNDFVKILS